MPGRTFSLRSLFVVIAVLGVLFALVALYLRSSHEDFRRAHCKNNIRQLSLALTGFDARQGHYPGYQQDLAGKTVSWPVAILPEIGRLDLYDLTVNTKNPSRPFMEICVCPRDPASRLETSEISYVANAGMASTSNEKPANGIMHDRVNNPVFTSAKYVAEHDGVSQTLLLSKNLQATQWWIPGKQDTVFVWHATTNPVWEQRINRNRLKAVLSPNTARPSSNHPGGVVVSFCDARVVFLNQDIDYKVYVHLMTPHGAESDMPEEWKGYQLDDDW